MCEFALLHSTIVIACNCLIWKSAAGSIVKKDNDTAGIYLLKKGGPSIFLDIELVAGPGSGYQYNVNSPTLGGQQVVPAHVVSIQKV